jgi:uncharacterized protein (DUF4415 family)
MFEWDEAKRQANLAKHGIDFLDVLGVFAHPSGSSWPMPAATTASCAWSPWRRFKAGCCTSPGPGAAATAGSSRPARPTHGSSATMSASATKPEPTTRAILAADGRVLLEQPDGSYRPAEGHTDWARVDATSEAELAAAIAADPEDPANDPGFWERAEVVYPATKERVTLRLDRDVLAWFRSQGQGYQTRINAVLRAYMAAARKAG